LPGDHVNVNGADAEWLKESRQKNPTARAVATYSYCEHLMYSVRQNNSFLLVTVTF